MMSITSTRLSVVICLIFFILVIAGITVTQGTTSDCFVNNVGTFMDGQDCSPYDIFDSGQSITNATLSDFCPSQCAIAVNIFFEAACNLSYSEIVCSRNEDNTRYCVDFQYIDEQLTTEILQPMRAACLDSNCSQSDACNASVQALPCCINEANRFLTEIDGRPALLSSDCTVVSSVCNIPDYADLITTYTEPALVTQMNIVGPTNSADVTAVVHLTVVLALLVYSCATVWS
ncbi:uncharacterized protein LOC135351526 [Halichondria panicea]|uniref:uncharacterized protein LOC135351526 n=1 Tax=Halichondria panicea TaxID=6063 RepID=UPI00312BC91B